MLKKFKSILKDDFDNLQGKQLYLAISGGKDSICLSQLLSAAGFSHTLLHCNFQLRGNQSNLDEQFLEKYSKQNNLDIHIKKFDTTQIAQKQNLTIQETARNLRYNWFNTFLTTSNKVLITAHHSDDAIETFFINLMRGTALRGLTGIKNKKGQIIRPLMSFNVDEINSHIKQNNIKFRQDQSNTDTKYLRNYLREEIIPAFEKRSENFKPKVVKTIQSLKEADSWIEKQAISFRNENFNQTNGIFSVDKNLIITQDLFFLTYLLKPFDIHRSNVNSLINALSKSTGAKFLTSSFQFTVNRGQILITENLASQNELNSVSSVYQNKANQAINTFPFKLIIDNLNLNFTVHSKHFPFTDNNFQQTDLSKIIMPLTVRPWRHGDRIQPLGMKGSKLISDILIDKKIPLINKSKILVLVDSNENIIAVPGMLISEKVKIISTTNQVLSLQLSNTD